MDVYFLNTIPSDEHEMGELSLQIGNDIQRDTKAEKVEVYNTSKRKKKNFQWMYMTVRLYMPDGNILERRYDIEGYTLKYDQKERPVK